MTAPRHRNGASVAFIVRSCEGKRRFADEMDVRAVGMADAERSGDRLYVYRCRFCMGWHLSKNANNGERNAVDFYVREPDGERSIKEKKWMPRQR